MQNLTKGVSADAVLECVGTGVSLIQAPRSERPAAMVGWVGAPHGVDLPPGGASGATSASVANPPAPRYLETLDVEPTTRARYEGIVRNHLRPALGPLPLSKLDGDTLERR